MMSGMRVRSGRRGTARLRAGTLLALLALLGQMIVSLLPMPALAADGTPLCQLDLPSGPDSAPQDKQTGHHAPDYCPVCQAVQLLGSLVPPTPVALPPGPARIWTAEYTRVDAIRPHRAASRHQARAPPPSV